jgi:hypothetical protein
MSAYVVATWSLTREQELRHLGREASRQADQAIGALGEQLLVDPRTVVEALQVRVRDQLQQVPVAGRVAGQDREVAVLLLALPWRALEARRGRHVGLDADDRLDAGRDPRLVEPERAEHRPVVGDRERRHPGCLRAFEQGVDPRGAVQERELGVGVEVDEALHAVPLASSEPGSLWETCGLLTRL